MRRAIRRGVDPPWEPLPLRVPHASRTRRPGGLGPSPGRLRAMAWATKHRAGNDKESPLERKPPPRRLAAQSLAEERRLDLIEAAVPWLTLPAFCWAVFTIDLLRWLWSAPPSPGAMAALAAVGTTVSLVKLRRIYRDLISVGRGIKGERYVGQVLEDLCRPRGYAVLHDLPSDTGDFNVDHVLVGPEGVFAVQTKHYYGPTKGARAIVYDGQSVKIPGVTSRRRRGRADEGGRQLRPHRCSAAPPAGRSRFAPCLSSPAGSSSSGVGGRRCGC